VPGSLYLIPTLLGDTPPDLVLPPTVRGVITRIDTYIVENEKTARRFIKAVVPDKSQPGLTLFTLNKHTQAAAHHSMLQACMEGTDVGLMSEAGCPGVADPGADIVKIAHEKGIRVIPLVGPSSILLAVMASGMNGQSFAFNGYLPIDKPEKKAALKNLERLSLEKDQSQAFIETPYRNNKMLDDILEAVHPSTLVCVAADITLPTEFIRTLPAASWKKNRPDLNKRPAIFILYKTK
jgi:16S rRNA (cytidine1402-2'-O)-methyltransferase